MSVVTKTTLDKFVDYRHTLNTLSLTDTPVFLQIETVSSSLSNEMKPIEFFLNVSLNPTNSVTKIFVIKRARTYQLLCKRPGWYHSASKHM